MEITKIVRGSMANMDYIDLDVQGEDIVEVESLPGGIVGVWVTRIPLLQLIETLREAGLVIIDPEREDVGGVD